MKKISFSLYGLIIGATCAAYGGAIFGLVLLFGLFGFDVFTGNLFDMFMNYIFATLYSVIFAVVPGAIGGMYLAYWIAKSERAPNEIRQRGLIVGAAAGLVTSAIVVFMVFRDTADVTFLGYAVFATLIAAGMSWLAASLLAKDRKKVVNG